MVSVGLSCFVSSSFDVTSSLLPLRSPSHLSTPTTKLFPPLLPSSSEPCSVYITPYPPCLGYSSLIILLQSISFKPRHPPTAFSLLPHRRFIRLLSGMINPSQLTTLYRIGSQIRLPRRPSSPNRLSLRLPKLVLIVKPPLRRYGAEMRRVSPSVTPVVSPTFHFHSLHVCVCLSITHLIHVSKCVERMPSTTHSSHG